MHWEAPLEGNLDSEVPQVRNLTEAKVVKKKKAIFWPIF